MKRIHWFVLSAFIVLPGWNMQAQTSDEVFRRGNTLYTAGQFEAAVHEYEQILTSGYGSAELYFNLGNAYYRNGKLARAILSYERAAQLHPNDPDIEHNLRLVYLKTVDRIEPMPEMFFIQWMRTIGSFASPDTIRMFFLFGWGVLFGSLAVMYLVLRPEIIRGARIVFFISCACVVCGALLIGIQSFRETSQDKGIITADIVTAKSSPDEKSVDAFVIHEGIKVKLTDAVNSWVKITLPDGKVGWIPGSQCERI